MKTKEIFSVSFMTASRGGKDRFRDQRLLSRASHSHELTHLLCQPNMMDYVIVPHTGPHPCKDIAHPSPFPGNSSSSIRWSTLSATLSGLAVDLSEPMNVNGGCNVPVPSKHLEESHFSANSIFLSATKIVGPK